MASESRWTTSIDALLTCFREALGVLVPVVERVEMNWREPDAYDDWDHICEAIYRSIVVSSIENAEEIGPFLSIPEYDRRVSSYQRNSFICNSSSNGKSAFICFETKALPFDQSRFAILNDVFELLEYRTIRTDEVKFLLCARGREGEELKFHDALKVLL
jgi:hypothetical protein